MKANIEQWTIVVTGEWNVNIFKPEWLAKYIFETNKIDIEMAIAPGRQIMRLLLDDFILIPSTERLVLGFKNTSRETLKMGEQYIIKILDMLKHTPISGMGVNFGFYEPSPNTFLLDLFKLQDVNRLSKNEYQVSRTEIIRSIALKDTLLNVNHIYDNGEVYINMNYHHDIIVSEMLCEKMHDQVLAYHDHSLKYIKDIYDTVMEEGIGEND